MRILRLCFHNLNSLTGKWEIDFTHPSFTGDGIFAITGPTGAGKTTLLDALCLALYGRTPRLDKVNKSGNEIMSRQSGECSAEVEFSTINGKYRCYWYQNRSRKKPDGALQPPKRELSVLDTGQILAESINDISGKVEEITGMDFGRFTRSMLLAQGGFAAFLQASQDERAPILEQITGSGIYTEISQRVHERFSVESNRQAKMLEQAAAMQLLTLEETTALQQEVESLRAEEVRLGRETEQRTAALTWLARLAALREECTSIRTKQGELAIEEQKFFQNEQRLILAQQAMVLAGDHAVLVSTRSRQQEASKEVNILRLKLPEIETVRAEAAQRLSRSTALLEESKIALEQTNPFLKQVRALDLRLAEKEAVLRKDTAKCAELRRNNTIDLDKCKKLDLEMSKAEGGLEKIRTYLAEHQVDEQLVTDLTGIHWMLDQLGRLADQYAAVGMARDKAEQQVALSRQAWKEKMQVCSAKEKQLTAVRQQREEVRREAEEQLNGRTVEKLRSEVTLLSEQCNLLARLLEIIRQKAVVEQDITGLDRRQKQLAADRKEQDNTILLLTQERNKAHQEAEVQRTYVALANRVRDLEEERQRLRDNCPCPLCGSPEHPYAQGNIPELDAVEQNLQTALTASQQAEKVLSEAKSKGAKLEQEGLDLDSRSKEKKSAVQEAELLIGKCCNEFSTLVPGADNELAGQSTAGLLTRLAELEQRFTKNRQQLDELDQLDKKLFKINQLVEKKIDIVVQADKERERAAYTQEKAEKEQQQLADEYKKLEQELQKSCGKAQEKLAVYGIAELPINGLEKLSAELAARQDQWRRRQNEFHTTERKIASLLTEAKELRAGIETRSNHIKEEERAVEENSKERQSLAEERFQLFADKNPDAEEKQLTQAVRNADTKMQQVQQEHSRLLKEHDLLAADVCSRDAAIAKRSGQLELLESFFIQQLRANNFADEVAWCAASLDEEQRTALSRQADELRTSRAQLDGLLRDRETRLAEEEKLQLTETEKEQLQNEHKELVDCRTRITEKIGSLQQRLRSNELLCTQQHELRCCLEVQKKEFLRWKMLHDLIGSGDGKKYRNFAQGLTFEQMVSHANRQLAKMTDRYLLIRDHDQPLELNVIDSWQAGEIRSTKNLSGGESFVVSLALALGLSNMVGGNVRVDSLFLDEGFGALDDEALETALETLAGLRREGKLIGVISHVAALKERIACQVEIIPGSSGQSVVKGPGIQRKD